MLLTFGSNFGVVLCVLKMVVLASQALVRLEVVDPESSSSLLAPEGIKFLSWNLFVLD